VSGVDDFDSVADWFESAAADFGSGVPDPPHWTTRSAQPNRPKRENTVDPNLFVPITILPARIVHFKDE